MKNILFVIPLIVLVLFGYQTVLASEITGSILDGSNITRVCKNSNCSQYGNVNWKPTLNQNTNGATAVSINDSGITGYLWGDEIGWINMHPSGYGVSINPNSGALSGYAWSNVGSWINFSPTNITGGTNVGVTINSQGEFSGWAYVSGINGGWMKFDCSNSSTCIRTDWRPIANRTTQNQGSTGSYSTSGGSVDLQKVFGINLRQNDKSEQYSQSNGTDLISPDLYNVGNSDGSNDSGKSRISVSKKQNSVNSILSENKSNKTFFGDFTQSKAFKITSFILLITLAIFILRMLILI